MKRKLTFLITAAFMLLTMVATTGTMWGQTRDTKTEGFETATAATTYNSTATVSTNQSDCGIGWSIYYGNVSTTQAITGSKSCLIRYYTADAVLGYAKTTTGIQGLSNITFNAKVTNTGNKMGVWYSTDGNTWTALATDVTLTTSSASKSYDIPNSSSSTTYYVKIGLTTGSSTNKKDLIFDDVVFTYSTGGSDLEDSDLALTGSPVALQFDIYNNTATQTVSYTTSSTGAITITPASPTSYFSYVHDAGNKTITVTPLAVTPGEQTVTIAQSADNTYAAGSKTFTIEITDSTPFTGGDVTFNANADTGTSPLVKNGVSFACSNGVLNNGSEYRLYKNSTTTFSLSDNLVNDGYKITQIAFTGVSGNPASGFATQDGWTTNGDNGTWEGEATSVSFTASGAQVRATQIVVTVEIPSNTLSVTYDGNGNTGGSVPTDSNEYDDGNNTVTVLGNTGNLVKAGYVWSGWNTQPNGEGTTYQANATFTITANTTLYAKWNAKTITDLSCTGTPTKTSYNSGESFDPTGLTVTATFNDESSENVTALVTWTPDPLTTGTTSVTGTYMGQTINFSGLTVTAAPGSADNPYTVAQARAAIDAGTGLTGVYATGIISQVDSYNSTYNSITYWISSDGTTTSDQLEVYSGKGLNNTNFSSIDDVKVGATVVVYGTLKKYGDVYEFDKNNYLTSYTAPVITVEAPTFSPVAGTYDEAQSVTLSCITDGATIYYTLNGNDPTNASTQYTTAINVASTTTIKAIAYVGDDYSTVATATYTIVSLNNISDITEVGTAYSVKGTVVATNSNGFVMGDGTGYIYYYKNGDTGKSVGDLVKVSGTTGTYGQIIQFTNSATVTEAATSNYNNTPAATVITEVPDYSTSYHLSTYLEFEGTLTKSGSNYLITLGESQIQISYPTTAQSTALTALDGKTVHVKGYFTGINSSSKFTVMLESAEEVIITTPSVTITNATVNVTAVGGNGTIDVTYSNIEPDDINSVAQFFASDGETSATYDWISVEFNDEKDAVYTVEANDGEARTAYFKVYEQSEGIYSNLVTINQAKYVVDYATLPFEFDGGSSAISSTNGLTQNELGTDYSSSPKLKFDTTNDWVILKINERPGVLTFDIKGNGFSGSTFKVQTSEDGETYTDLKTYTELGNKQSEEFSSLGENVRYIKWIYTEKVNGNVALGNIELAAYQEQQEQVATPTFTPEAGEYNAAQNVTIACATNGATIHYTTNGDTPTAESTEYTAAIPVTTTTTIKAIAVKEGMANSAVATATYTITAPVPAITASDVNLTYNATSGSIAYEITNPVDGGALTAAITDGNEGSWLALGAVGESAVALTCSANEGNADRTATVTLTYTYNTNETVTKTVTVTQAHFVVDYATLPFNWAGGSSTDFNALNGVTTNGLGSDYAAGNAPYLIKLDGNGDYIQVKTNEQPGKVTIGVKMAGGSNTSKITVQASADGESFDDGEELTISGAQNDIVNLETTRSFNTDVRYVKMVFTKGSNVGVGPITIAQVDNTPSITADDVNIAHDATGGSISYTINNPVEGGSMSSTPTSGGDWLTVGGPSNGSVALTCEQNTGAERTATVRLTYTYNTNQTVIKDVTVTQEGAPAPTFIVSFTVGNDGIFVPNNDFPQDVVEKEAGTYHLPSATKEGYDFTGWSDGNTTYEADAEYTVSDDVDFTAQWTESTTTTGTIAFGSASGSTPINSTSVTGDDNLGNEWTITTVFSGETSFTQNASYSQIGASSKPATSITFTMTLPQQKIISAFEAKFGGFSNTAGDITLKVGDVNVGSGSLNATNDVTVQATNTTEVGTVLTVTVTNIAKGVKCYYISYTLSPAPVVPTINATSGSNLAYNDTSGSIIYEIENYEEGTMEAASDADWINNIAVEEDDEMGEVTFDVTENTSNESRSATVTLTFTYDTDKTATANVTVTQNGQPGQPSITVDPESAVVVSDGDAPEFTITYASIAIANANDFDVQFYESNGTSTTTQPSWISDLTISGNTTDGFTLTVTVDANTSAERAAYLKVYALDGDDIIYSNLITISQNEYIPPATYTLVTDIDQVVSGKHYIIASSAENGTAYAMGAQNTNNRAGVAVTVSDANITQTGGVYEFVINGPNDGKYTIYDKINSGYLYAASRSSNYLKTETELDNNGRWSINVANTGVATIIANGTNTRNNMRYNSNSKLFSCYSSGQSDVYIYVKDDDTELEYYGDPVSLEASAFDFTHNTYSVGGTMTITGGPVANDPSSLIIQDGAQLIHESPINATVQNGVTAAPSWTSNVGGGWYFIASPVDDAVIAESILVEPFDLYKYDEPEAMWYAYNGSGAPFTTMERGIGYLHASADDQILAFAGEMIGTETEITKTLSYECTYDDLKGYNLMGNPFTRVLEYRDITLDGEYVTSFLSLNDAGTEYVTCNLQDNARIRPCQGFFIQATGAGQNLVFNPAKKDKSEIGLISIKAGNEEFMDKAYIQIGGGNTLRKIAFSDNNMVYVMDGDDDYAAMTIYELANPIPVHFVAAEPGTYTITVNAKNIDLDYMHLVDEFTNEHIDLLSEPTYTFTSAEGDKPGRFTIVFGIDNVEENFESNVFAYQNEDELMVDGNGTLQIFDVLGRFVGSHEVHGSERISLSSFNTGVYVLRMVGNNVKTQKIVVR